MCCDDDEGIVPTESAGVLSACFLANVLVLYNCYLDFCLWGHHYICTISIEFWCDFFLPPLLLNFKRFSSNANT
jgi:hypothetical protein